MSTAQPDTPTIVVVDRDRDRADRIVSELDDADFRGVTVTDGKDVPARIARYEPDLVLLDVAPGGEDALDVCRRLKADARTASVPVVMMMTLNRLEDMDRGMQAGTEDFLTRPINPQELVTRVKSLLRLRRLRTALDQAQGFGRSSGSE